MSTRHPRSPTKSKISDILHLPTKVKILFSGLYSARWIGSAEYVPLSMSCTWRKMKDWYELSLLIYWVVISLVISIWYSHLIVISRHVWTMWFHFSYCAGEPYLFEPYSYEPYFIHSWTKWWYNLEVGLVLLSWSILTTVFQRKIGKMQLLWFEALKS